MLAGTVAGWAGDENDFFIGGLRANEAGDQGKSGEQLFHVRNKLLGFLFVHYREKAGIGFGREGCGPGAAFGIVTNAKSVRGRLINRRHLMVIAVLGPMMDVHLFWIL